MKMLAGLTSRWMTPRLWAYSSPSQISIARSDFPRQAHFLGPSQPPLEILPFEVLHRQVRLPLVLAEIVDGDDVLVRQLTGGASLAKEPLAHLRVRFDRARDDLDRDDALDQRIEGPVDDTHAALTELLVELIAANRLH